ncbi:DNA primase family protein [Christiangramia aquimixticola]|uniref:DNA primase family protein n=1 Tax=Christiangramia aquimixticola TaxID=1697558 RepID=UPI003AA7ED44
MTNIKNIPQVIKNEQPTINISDLLEESKHVNKQKSIPQLLKFILQNLEEKDFKIEADFKDDDKPLPRKHYLVLSIQFVLEKSKELDLDIIFRNGKIYLFNSEYWETVEEDIFRYFLGEAALKMGVNKFDAKFFKFKEDLYKQFEAEGKLQQVEPEAGKTLINLKNGTFEINENTQKLREFRKVDFLTYQLPFEYDEHATPDLFIKFLNEVIPKAELHNILAEYLGSIFIQNSVLKLEKALFLYGTGSNGKSVVFDIISAILGIENLSNYSLESLTKDKDSRAMIADKLLNYCSETSTSVQSEMFKKLVSKEPIDVRPVYKSSYIMKDYARLMFNCNELPSEIEHTHAFFRRFLIIPFEVTIKEEDQDKNLSTKIIQYELPGIFNWILIGMNRLLKNGRFTPSKIVEDEIKKFRRESDSVLNFVDDSNYLISTTEEIMLKDLYQDYRIFCSENNNRACSRRTFSKRLKNEGFDSKRKNTGMVVFAEKKDLD